LARPSRQYRLPYEQRADAVIEGVFAYRFNGFADRFAIQQLFLIHDFCVVMADFNHLRQRPVLASVITLVL
jgi:hypothetical protein